MERAGRHVRGSVTDFTRRILYLREEEKCAQLGIKSRARTLVNAKDEVRGGNADQGSGVEGQDTAGTLVITRAAILTLA